MANRRSRLLGNYQQDHAAGSMPRLVACWITESPGLQVHCRIVEHYIYFAGASGWKTNEAS
jgi:hypothetical protein